MCLPIILVLFLFSYPYNVISQPYDYPTANLSTSWTNSISANHSLSFDDNSTIRAILLRSQSWGPSYACGFYCNGNCETYLFAIFIVQTNSGGRITMTSNGFPQVVWSANPNNAVQINSTLELTSTGDLVLTDASGTMVWSTGTSGMSVGELKLTDLGNLVLFDMNQAVVWQSFDHPTDTLVPGQSLVSGRDLTASVSSTNWTQGGLSLSMGNLGFEASVYSDPPQVYYKNLYDSEKLNREASFARFQNGSIGLYINSTSNPNFSINVSAASSAQYVKLMPNGHFMSFEWEPNAEKWTPVADLMNLYSGDCKYPTVCGEYGICSNNGQCSCPVSSSGSEFFRLIDDRQPNLGCSEVVPLTCDVTSNHSFLDLDNATYFNFNADISGIDVNSCREACLRNCSCRAAIFIYTFNSSGGDCYLPSQIFSVMNNEKDKTHYNSSVSIKVQISPSVAPQVPPVTPTARTNRGAILGAILGSTIGGTFIAIVLGILVYNYRKKKNDEEAEEDYLDLLPGMPARFSHEELVNATDNFNKKLGQGGFGSVFQGVLNDSTQIAVKCLDGIGQIRESFLAEVKTIGSIHHINLVKLVGFCADKSHRLLVYEYMCNGSLDRWIYSSNEEKKLDWRLMRKIILDIAKGLAYLHEDCRQKIIHLDIKPQNILLDESFNAKLADFGLSKLIDRDQSQVVTTMRGTPGYLAPEWLSAGITEKVDVYSFGIVILEIVCGRRNFEQSQPEEERHLLNLFKKKAMEGRWLDIVDKTIVEMQSDGTEAVEMMQIAAWCLQTDYTKRPSMSTVVKVLEGVTDVDKDINLNFLIPYYLVQRVQEIGSDDGTPFLTSDFSGPG